MHPLSGVFSLLIGLSLSVISPLTQSLYPLAGLGHPLSNLRTKAFLEKLLRSHISFFLSNVILYKWYLSGFKYKGVVVWISYQIYGREATFHGVPAYSACSCFSFERATEKNATWTFHRKVRHPNCMGSLSDHLLQTSKNSSPELVPRNFLERSVRALTMNYYLWVARHERGSICAK